MNMNFVKNPDLLCIQLRLWGIISIVGLAPICVFVFVYFFMRHTEDFRSHRNSPLEKQYTGFAEWYSVCILNIF